MTARVGPKGQVVIPKALREQLSVAPGDEVEFFFDSAAQEVRVRKVGPSGGSLRGRFKGAGLLEELARDRERERAR